MIPQGIEIFVATEPVDMRFGFERLGALVRERMQREPRSRSAMFVFIGKRKLSLKVLWWDGTGIILLYKKLDKGVFELPLAACKEDRSVVLSESAFEAIFAGLRRVVH